MITKYGYDVFFTICGISLIGIYVGSFLSSDIFRWTIWIFSAALFLFSLNFFRDPNRTTPNIECGVISPADGKVVLIQEVEEKEFLKGKAKQISIFMSPLNVHVNRFPMDGKVAFFQHIPGKFMVAFEDKSSEVNERTLIGLETNYGKILFKQIAGFVARRIVANLNVGDIAKCGERFGMIKFGSRVDVLLPLHSEIKVKLGDITVAGETVIAMMPKR
ncbi:MAG: phosphatidylserine decarboxylase family protein [Ignavibacteria bacterium]|nr:phosphatidylserine decarboxylase family protein [Ignavibacteria bacterium]